ncbi:hypothetical protein HRbin04_01299 [archaeon HR04]|nr:hypothetical protein HRbin04_01299 [archaeon HR04]
MKSVFIVWGFAPALAIATVLILNMLSTGMQGERGEGLAGTGEGGGEGGVGGKGKVEGEGEGEESMGYTVRQEQGQEQASAKSREMVGITSEPAGEPKLQREAQEQGEQYIRAVLPYITGALVASISFIIVRRFVYKQG